MAKWSMLKNIIYPYAKCSILQRLNILVRTKFCISQLPTTLMTVPIGFEEGALGRNLLFSCLRNVSSPTRSQERAWEYRDAKYNIPHCKI